MTRRADVKSFEKVSLVSSSARSTYRRDGNTCCFLYVHTVQKLDLERLRE